jgi:Protein of unknown function (DUF3572)
MARAPQMTSELAELVAIQALGFIAGEPDRLGRFLALTGIGPQSLRTAAQEPNFLLGVLDHLTGDDSLLREFADQSEIDPETVVRAREQLWAGSQNPAC